MYDIAIIGAGASGLAASIFAKKENRNIDVVLFDRADRVGKKIATSGNGQCNITNATPDISRYHGDPTFAKKVIDNFPPAEQQRFFEECGIMLNFENSGKAYPMSYQASSVVDALRFRAAELGVEIKTSCRVESVSKKENGFSVKYEGGCVTAKNVIVAAGGIAGGNLGSEDGYNVLKSFGHKVTSLRPAIVQLKSNEPFIRSLKGVKLFAKLTARSGKNTYSADPSDFLFTDYGISGPAVLSLSSHYKEGEKFSVFADLLPDSNEEKTCKFLSFKRAAFGNRTADELFAGLVHKKIGIELVKLAKIAPSSKIGDISDEKIKSLASLVHNLPFNITGTNGMKNAQVTAGGVDTKDFCADTMMSKLHDGLFATGEVLNVDGDCGGFNLCFAWASGKAAGIAAAKRVGK
ncbi:MAG: aminoacetone oxidase family FAD-binding enzyme [Clostridia bacterium]|nr:aminoacetone oxidase family FAD-binding enzyme [Clostridia bacterium]